jgi:peptide/nickel transport system substrate-binding protein
MGLYTLVMRRALPAAIGLCAVLAACRQQPGSGAPDAIAVALPYELATLDPHADDKLSHAAVLTNIYEPIVATDADLRVRPCLAQSWESPDPVTWVFRLRPGVAFHSGRLLRAADVVYSYGRLLGSADRDLELRGYLRNISEVHVLDDRTIQIKTLGPARILLNKLSHVPIVPEGATRESLSAAPDGTGPYVVASHTGHEAIALVRNERYWGQPPALRRVELALGRNADEALSGLLAGRYQLVKCDSKRAEAAVAGRFDVLRRDNVFVKYLAFDLDRDETPFCPVRPNPFKNPLVRRAIQLSIDRQRLGAGLSNYAVPATQPVPRLVFGFNPAIGDVVPDLDEARALLRKAGLPSGFSVVLHARRTLGEAPALLREQLAAVGIDVDVRVLADDAFFELLSRNGATLWINRYGCSSGDASDFLDAVVHSPDPGHRFGMSNYGRYSNAALDKAIERSGGIEKPEERRNAVQQILAQVMQELVLLPLYSDQDVYVLDRSFSWEPRSDSYVHAAEVRLRK